VSRSTRRLLTAVTGIALLTSACGGGSTGSATGTDAGAAPTAAAGSEPLVVYSGRSEDLVQPLIDAFTASSGIEVEVRYDGSSALAATLLEEGKNTPADIFFSQDAGALGALENAGLLDEIDAAQYDRVDPRYSSAERRWVGTSGRARVLVYNPELVAEDELPGSVLDLVDPAYKGKVAFAPTNASWQSFVTALRVTEGEDAARTFLTGFAADDPVDYERNGEIVDAVNAGQVPMGLVNHYYLYEKASASAGGLEAYTARNHAFDAGDPGNLINTAGVGVLTGKTDERTSAFVEFLLSEQAQTAFAEQTYEYPVVKGITATVEGAPPLEEVQGPDVDLSDLDTLEQTQALLREVGLLS
jgi:iron(III) transport system substrate-binding protein